MLTHLPTVICKKNNHNTTMIAGSAIDIIRAYVHKFIRQ